MGKNKLNGGVGTIAAAIFTTIPLNLDPYCDSGRVLCFAVWVATARG